MTVGHIGILPVLPAGWAPWPAFTENPVARDGCDNGRKAETGE
jgi:hypothetical protein